MEVMGNDLSRGLFPVKEVKLLNSLRWALLLAMSLANRFKDLYRGQLFNLWSSSAFFPLKISLLEMLIAFGDSKTFTEGNFSTSGPPLFFPENFTPRDVHYFWWREVGQGRIKREI